MNRRAWSVAALLAVSFFLGSSRCGAAQTLSRPEQALMRAEARWNFAFERGDRRTLATLLTDDFATTLEDGAGLNRDAYLSLSTSGALRYQVSKYFSMQVHIHGDIAVVTGAHYEKGQFRGAPFEQTGRFTDVWIRNKNGWRCLASHYGIPLQR